MQIGRSRAAVLPTAVLFVMTAAMCAGAVDEPSAGDAARFLRDVLSAGARFKPTVGLGIAVGGLAIDLALVPSSLGATYLGGFQVEL